MFKKSFALLVLATLLVFVGCGKKETGIAKIKKAGKITVYSNPEFPPYEYLGKNGKIVGAEIDIVNKIGAKLGVEVNLVSAEFDSIIGSVVTGKADLGASGFTINEERKKKIDFSIPFVSSVQYLILPEDSPIKTVEDMAGKKIGGQNATTGFLMIEDCLSKGILKGSGAEAKSYNNSPDALVAMKAGQIDVVVIDELVAKSLAAKNPGYKAIPMVDKEGKGLDLPEEFGIIVAKENAELLPVINEVIREMIADGSLAKAIDDHRTAASLE